MNGKPTHSPVDLTLEALLAAKEELRTPPPFFEIWVASYGPEGMNCLSLPAVSALGGGIEHRYSYTLADRVVIMRREVLEQLLANGTPLLEGIPIYYKDEELEEET